MEFDLDEIIEALREGLQDSAQQSFADMCAAECAIANREVFVGTIGPGLGDNIDMYIRYWNMKDDEAGIPVDWHFLSIPNPISPPLISLLLFFSSNFL